MIATLKTLTAVMLLSAIVSAQEDVQARMRAWSQALGVECQNVARRCGRKRANSGERSKYVPGVAACQRSSGVYADGSSAVDWTKH